MHNVLLCFCMRSHTHKRCRCLLYPSIALGMVLIGLRHDLGGMLVIIGGTVSTFSLAAWQVYRGKIRADHDRVVAVRAVHNMRHDVGEEEYIRILTTLFNKPGLGWQKWTLAPSCSPCARAAVLRVATIPVPMLPRLYGLGVASRRLLIGWLRCQLTAGLPLLASASTCPS